MEQWINSSGSMGGESNAQTSSLAGKVSIAGGRAGSVVAGAKDPTIPLSDYPAAMATMGSLRGEPPVEPSK